MTNSSNNETLVSICCNPNELDPGDTFCYQNATFSIWSIFAKHFPNVTMTATSHESSCNGTIFDLEAFPPNNDDFSLWYNGMIFVRKSQWAGTKRFVMDTTEYCYTSRLTDYGRKFVISGCAIIDGVVPLIDISLVGPQIVLGAIGLSLPFLVATFFVYTIVPELKNVPGFTLRAYAATLFVYYTLYLIMIKNLYLFCYYHLAFILHFTILSHYFWLNIMCFDIWWTFRRVRSVQRESKRANRKRCIMYSIFAWGSAALITVVGAIIDGVPILPKGIIKPGLHEFCWFVETIPTIVYYIGPMGLTIVCNISFFVLTTITIIRHDKNTANRLNGSEDQLHNQEKQRLNLYLKLFTIMGIGWIFEVILWQWEQELPLYVTVILNLPMSLQGVFIFVTFVCKEKTKKLLLKRLGRGERTDRPWTVQLRPNN